MSARIFLSESQIRYPMTKTYILYPAMALAVAVAAFLFGRWTSNPPTVHDHPRTIDSAQTENWTCSMHPQVRLPEPGQCPICGMDLVPVNASIDELEPGDGAVLVLSESNRARATVETRPVERRFPLKDVRMVGSVEFDETRVRTLTARFPARLERLFLDYTGVAVGKGDHLALVYSPELLTAQSELLSSTRLAGGDRLLSDAARRKMVLWGFSEEQVSAILERGVATDQLELDAPIEGIVIEKFVNEGDYVETGTPLFSIADLSTVWLVLRAYESDLQWLHYGQEMEFEVVSFPGERFEGQIVFIDPVLDDQTRTVGVRVVVPNPDGRLKPGMFARAIVHSTVGSDGRVIAPDLTGEWICPMHPQIVKDEAGTCDICKMDLVSAESLGFVNRTQPTPPLVVPASAVLRTGRRAVVYVAVPDQARPTYEGREITLGPRAGDLFVVMHGLHEGENVVTRGAFKIDSALQIMARPSMMNPKNGGSMSGHDHQPPTAPATVAEPYGRDGDASALAFTPDETRRMLKPYFDLHRALAWDSLPEAKAALATMLEAVGHSSGPADLLHEMLAEDSLEGIRRPLFEYLSNSLITAIREDENAFDQTLFLKHCPMVYPDRGADWLQLSEDTLNPYFGAAMQVCGETKETLGSP
jgi:Cu(I)/Ag(I) efflux system membrane fusion protein